MVSNSSKREDEIMVNAETTAETTARGRTLGAVRCLNCFVRISPPRGVTTYKCPHCRFEWRISWPLPDQPRIRGPVWEVNKRLAEEAMRREKEEQE